MGGGDGYAQDMSERKAVIGLLVLTGDTAQFKELHAHVVSQVRLGARDIWKDIEKHNDESWAEEDF